MIPHSYLDKNKHIKKNLAVNFESLTQTIDSEILNKKKRRFSQIFTILLGYIQ